MANKIGHFLGLIFILILLFSTRSYLGTNPLLSAVCFLFFTVLYLVTTIQTKERIFIYPVLFFGTLAYYLFLYLINVPTLTFPAFSLVFVFGLLTAALHLEKRDLQYYTIPLYRGILYTSIIFTMWIFLDTTFYYTQMALVPLIMFLGYSAFYHFRNVHSQKTRHLYFALFYFAAFYLAVLYILPFIASSVYGLLLMGLVALGVYSGTVFHKSKGISYCLPFYVVSFLALFLSFIYSGQSPSHFPLSLFLCGAIYWWGYEKIKHIRPTGLVDQMLPVTFLSLVNVSGLVTLLILILKGFPVHWMNILAPLFFSILYASIAINRKESFLKIRNHYIYLSGAFFTIFFFELLYMIKPFSTTQVNLLFSVIPLICVIVFAQYLEKKNRPDLAVSGFDVNYLVVTTALILSVLSEPYSQLLAGILSIVLLALFCVYLLVRKRPIMLLSIVLIVGFGYYNILESLGSRPSLTGILFLPVALVFMFLAFRYKKSVIPMRVTYFGWFLFTVAGMYLSFSYPVPSVITTAVGAASFLFMSPFIGSVIKKA